MDHDNEYDMFEVLVDEMYDSYMDALYGDDPVFTGILQSHRTRTMLKRTMYDLQRVFGNWETEWMRAAQGIDNMNGTHIKDIGDHNTFPTIEEYWGRK